MPIKLHLEPGHKVVDIYVSGTLVKADFERFLPKVERLISENGKLHARFDVTDLRGWDAGALWEEIKFDINHLSDFERVAVIGDKKWEHAMTCLCRPFVRATLRYFDENQGEEALQWLNSPTINRSMQGTTKPDVALVAITRFALGLGIGLLLAPRVTKKTRVAVGWTLLAVGVATTAPLLIEVFGVESPLANEGCPS